MRKLVEWTFVSLDGVIDSPEWAQPYMDDEHHRYAVALLDEADALLLGRKSYQGLADFWSKQTGELDKTLLEHRLLDELYLSMAPVVIGRGEHLLVGAQATFELLEATPFASGIVVLKYAPGPRR